MKKFLYFFLVFILSFSLLAVPVLAEGVDTGIMTTDEFDDYIMSVADYATAKYPTWTDFNKMRDGLPTTFTYEDIVYSIDKHLIAIGKTNAYEDGTAKIWLYGFDSSSTEITHRPATYYRLYVYDTGADVLPDTYLFNWYWDYESSSWVAGNSSDFIEAGDYFGYRQNGILWLDFNMRTWNAANDLTTYSHLSGIQDVYLSQLENDVLLGYPGYDDWAEEAPSEEEEKDYSGFWGWFQKIWDKLAEGFTSVKVAIESLAGSIGSFFSDLGNLFIQQITNLGNSIGTFFTDLWTNIQNLFVPAEGFMDGVMEEVYETNDNSDFIMAVRYFMDDIRDFVGQDFKTPPSFTVDLSANESNINLGEGKVSVFDVSWFSRYRKYTDPFLSALMWFFFFWAIAKNLPNILNGAGIVTDTPASIAETTYTVKEKDYNRQNSKLRTQALTEQRNYYARRNGRGGKYD